MKNWQTIWLVLGFSVLSGFGMAQTPAGPGQAVTLNISEQPLGNALAEFAQQAGLQLVFYSEIGEGFRSPHLAGSYSARGALDRLLADTPLMYEFLDARTVAIRGKGAEVGMKPAGGEASVDNAGGRVAQAEGASGVYATAVAGEGTEGKQKASDSEESSEGGKLEEIIVTAQKREERLLDTPQSVTVLSADTLAKLGAAQFRDFANTVPGLSFMTTGAGSTQISLRGVTTGVDLGPTVGIYVDEVPYGSSSAFAGGAQLALDVGLFDLDRIEVLRGPQGTLYGASTMGGLLKYVTKRPDATSLGVDAQTGIAGTRDGTISYNGAIAVNTPIVADKMALRASTFYSRDSGYITNRALDEDGVGRSDIYGGRADVLFTPSEALNIRMTAFLQNISRDGQATADYDFTGSPLNGRLEQSRRTAEPFDQHFRLISGIVNYELGSSKLTSISSYQTMRADSFLDVSAAYVPLLELFFGRSYSAVGVPVELGTDKFVQEVRLASEGNRPLEWLIGGFYTHESSKNKQALALRDPSGQLALNDLLTFSAPSQYDEYAAFGNLTWHLTSQLNLSGGVRYAENDQKFTQFGSGILGSSLPTNRAKENVFTYLANARYQFGDHATGYLRYATGYRPGGPNYVTIDPTTGLPVGAATFESDSLKSYEIGFKAETGDRRFGVDLAGYYIDWSNIQIQVIRGGLGAIANAPGGASVRGAELALTARPTGDFVLSGALAYQDAYMNEADPPVLPDFPAGRDLKNRKGERLPNVPRLTAALNADYSLAVGSLQPTIGATFRYVSERRASFDNNTSFPQYHLPDYTTLDLRTSLNLERFNVQLYVRNLFDERGELSAMHANFGTARVSILQPRTVGVSLTTHF